MGEYDDFLSGCIGRRPVLATTTASIPVLEDGLSELLLVLGSSSAARETKTGAHMSQISFLDCEAL